MPYSYLPEKLIRALCPLTQLLNSYMYHAMIRHSEDACVIIRIFPIF